MFDRNVFAARLREVRQSRKELMKDIAEALDVKVSMISMLESADRSPSVEALVLLAEHFAVSADYLLGLSNTSTPLVED